jgi:hypothetical protein
MSEAKIKAIIKRPDERYGHSTYISKSLANLQRTVEGPIQTVSLGLSNVIICNEEGKLRGLPENFKIYRPYFHDTIVGTVIVVGVEEEDFTDVSVSFDDRKRYLREWGNEP